MCSDDKIKGNVEQLIDNFNHFDQNIAKEIDSNDIVNISKSNAKNNELEYKNSCLHKVSLINDDHNIVNNQLNQLIAVNDDNTINCINTISSLMTNVNSKITTNVSTLISNNQQQIAITN